MSEKAVLYGVKGNEATEKVKAFLEEKKVAFEFIDIDEAAVGETIVKEMNDGERRIPMLVTPDGAFLRQPSEEELKKAFA